MFEGLIHWRYTCCQQGRPRAARSFALRAGQHHGAAPAGTVAAYM